MKNEADFVHEECKGRGNVRARFASFFMAAQPLLHICETNASFRRWRFAGGFSCFLGDFLLEWAKMEVVCVYSFTMLVAGLAVRVEPLFGSTREYCRAYWTELEPECTVAVTREELVREQELLDLEAMEECLKMRRFSEPFLERSVIQRRVAERLLDKNTIMLHGSTVAVDGRAYLFTAPCGTGKSTHTRLWREAFGNRAVMVNDDKPFLKLTDEGVLAFGSPWTGKHGLGENVCFPLAAVCVLRRGPENVIRRAAAADVMELLLHQVFQPEGTNVAAELVDRLSESVPLWEMECTKDKRAAIIAYEAMSGQIMDENQSLI